MRVGVPDYRGEFETIHSGVSEGAVEIPFLSTLSSNAYAPFYSYSYQYSTTQHPIDSYSGQLQIQIVYHMKSKVKFSQQKIPLKSGSRKERQTAFFAMLSQEKQQYILTVMWSDKRYNEQNSWYNTSTQGSKISQLTPRSKARPNVPLPNSRRSITPSKIQERVTASPLRAPLERAIEKCARERSQERPTSRSRLTNKSSRQGDSSIFSRRVHFEEEESIETNRRAHSQTVNFLKKYFDFQNSIPIDLFIERVIQDYGDLWGNQNADQLMEHFTWKVAQIFGEHIQPRDLVAITRDNGMIGLILQVFQSINDPEELAVRPTSVMFSKSPNVQSLNKSFEEQLSECVNIQHLKNIIQQFMELMYQEMQKQLYSKFNAEMKRMVLKHRDAERIIKKVQEKLTMNADFFEAEAKWLKKWKAQEEVIQELKNKLEKKDEEIKKEKDAYAEIKLFKAKLEEENGKLRDNIDKFQSILINKFENNPNSDTSILNPSSMPPLSRKVPSIGPLVDRTQQFSSQNGSFIGEPKPFQIKIDTHFIQRDSGPPTTHTTTTFMDNFNGPSPLPSYPMTQSHIGRSSCSPIKVGNGLMEGGRPSQDGGIKPGTKIGEYIYSPYQGKSGLRH